MNKHSYRWFSKGDINAFFALMPDNMATLVIMAGILMFGFNFPSHVIYTRMIPGTAIGVLVGDLIYSWLAVRLARRTGDPKVCAIPLGLDTPSSIGMAVAVLGPAFAGMVQQGMDPEQAAMKAWIIGMGAMFWIGFFKLLLSFCGNWLVRHVPKAGLLGSLAGIGLALIGYFSLSHIAAQPMLGMISMAIVLFSLVARGRLPFKLPGMLTAVLVCTILYHLAGMLQWLPAPYHFPELKAYFHLPVPTMHSLDGLVPALQYLPIILPFALLTVVGGIDVTASAHEVGDPYKTRSVLMTEAISTLVAGFFGGVAQTTPYAGYPAYKSMDARSGYTIMTALFIGLGGMLGYISFFVDFIPAASLAPILLFLAMLITAQPFISCPSRYAPAIVLAILPSVAQLVRIFLCDTKLIPFEHLQQLLNATENTGFSGTMMVFMLGNGFIVTGMLWGAFLAELIDRRTGRAALYLLVAAAFSFFGIIHSPDPSGAMNWPWNFSGTGRLLCYHVSLGYVLMAVVIFLLGRKATYETADGLETANASSGTRPKDFVAAGDNPRV
jgi:AGZA family xanthine/uracil permease-like MFS transporter